MLHLILQRIKIACVLSTERCRVATEWPLGTNGQTRDCSHGSNAAQRGQRIAYAKHTNAYALLLRRAGCFATCIALQPCCSWPVSCRCPSNPDTRRMKRSSSKRVGCRIYYPLLVLSYLEARSEPWVCRPTDQVASSGQRIVQSFSHLTRSHAMQVVLWTACLVGALLAGAGAAADGGAGSYLQREIVRH